VSDPCWASIPAPSASLVTGPAETLSATSESRTVNAPQLSIPPPAASAKRQSTAPHETPVSTLLLGAASLPTMSLRSIVTVAPGA
jgi:hypothetical protein